MEETSAFFGSCEELAEAGDRDIQKIYESPDGYTVVSRMTLDGKLTALKSLKPEYVGNPFYERLLRKEFEIGHGLDHPNICPVQDFVFLPGLGNCIVMQWIDGETLGSMLGKKELPTRKVVTELCNALEYLHHNQIIHKDLKPGNILITRNGYNVKLIDFGLSDADYYSICKYPAGTRDFVSPEQIAGESLDNRTDIYSLGRIMQRMGVYPRIAEVCSEKDRNRRYRDIGEVRAAILKRMKVRRLLYAAGFVAASALVYSFCLMLPDLRKEKERRAVDSVFEQVSAEIKKAGY